MRQERFSRAWSMVGWGVWGGAAALPPPDCATPVKSELKTERMRNRLAQLRREDKTNTGENLSCQTPEQE